MDLWFIMIQKWVVANPLMITFVVIPIVGAIFNWVSWQSDEAAWLDLQRRRPAFATFIRLMRALFVHLRKVPTLAPYLPPEPVTVVLNGSKVHMQKDRTYDYYEIVEFAYGPGKLSTGVYSITYSFRNEDNIHVGGSITPANGSIYPKPNMIINCVRT